MSASTRAPQKIRGDVDLETKRVAAVLGAIMIALGGLGFAYAHWIDTVIITGTVHTGEVDVDLSWWCFLPLTNDKPEYGEVATCSCRLLDDDVLEMTLNNAYPSLTVIVVLDVHNMGTIPVTFVDWFADESGMNGVHVEKVSEGWWSYDEIGATPNQLDPEGVFWYWFMLHVEQDSEQSAFGTATFTATFVNWNEAGTPPYTGPYFEVLPPMVELPYPPTGYYTACVGGP
jgi:hypothetical protein